MIQIKVVLIGVVLNKFRRYDFAMKINDNVHFFELMIKNYYNYYNDFDKVIFYTR